MTLLLILMRRDRHLGHDGRMYVIDTARVFPPEVPDPKYVKTTCLLLLSNVIAQCEGMWSVPTAETRVGEEFGIQFML